MTFSWLSKYRNNEILFTVKYFSYIKLFPSIFEIQNIFLLQVFRLKKNNSIKYNCNLILSDLYEALQSSTVWAIQLSNNKLSLKILFVSSDLRTKITLVYKHRKLQFGFICHKHN